MQIGCVYLVGAGPGDPELLTLKGLRLLQQADVILYDGLANPSLLLHAKETCEVVNVEKRPGFHRVQQGDINKLMIEYAGAGKSVVRLKGGDPIVFGRGGEEAEVLRQEGIPFEIVPGISSAIAAPAYAGIPVTHRGVSTHFTVVTGTTTALDGQHEVNWELLALAGGTLLILMGTRNRAEIAQRLISGGRAPETSVAIVYRGTTPFQKTTRIQLKDLAETPVENPAVIVVGPVAGIDFSWFESRPLWGKTIAVTRARTQASGLVSQLSVMGADVIEVPTIEVVPCDHWNLVDEAISRLNQTDWVVFTSTNGVDYFFERIFALNLDVRVFGQVKVASIGKATSDRIRNYHLHVDLEPTTNISEGLLEAFQKQVELEGVRILFPKAESARAILPNGLRNFGAVVEEVVVYKTVQPNALPERFKQVVAEKKLDLITFTSSSTVTNFVDMLDNFELLKDFQAACIGPITGKTATDYGIKIVVQPEADDISVDGLVNEIVTFFAK
jgi:uroporphyrinogen III methyltransferase/synthase